MAYLLIENYRLHYTMPFLCIATMHFLSNQHDNRYILFIKACIHVKIYLGISNLMFVLTPKFDMRL